MKPLSLAQIEDNAPIDDGMLQEVLAAFMPPVVLSSADWAEANIDLPEESNAEPGKLKLTAYQRGMLDAFDDPHTETLVLKLASQTGKSLVVDAALLASIAQTPGPMLLVHPTASKARSYVTDRFNPLARSTTEIASRITGDFITHKSFLGGSLNIASSHVAEDLAAKSIKLLLLDEVDRFALSAGTEGDPVSLARKRQRTFRNAKCIIASTPTAKGASRIEDWYQRGTQEKFAIPCPECGALQVPTIENLHWTPGKPKSAHLTCTDCAHPISERQRLKAIDNGAWLSFNPNPEAGIRSFHATELVSKFSSLASVAKQAEDATTPEQKKVFTNTVLAETYDLGEETFFEPETLQARAVPMLAPYSKRIKFVVAGIDVQRNRVEVLYLATGENGERWVLDRRVIGGDTTGPQVWSELRATLQRAAFPIEDGRRLPLTSTFIDSGDLATTVYEFCKANPRCIPIKGRGGWDRPTVALGKRIAGPLRLLTLGVDNIKLAVAKALALADPSAPNFIHLPQHLDAEFFEQLSAERLSTTYVRGFAKHVWSKDKDARNEAFDCLVYASAAAAAVTKPAKPINAKPQETVAQLAAQLNAASNTSTDDEPTNVFNLNSRRN